MSSLENNARRIADVALQRFADKQKKRILVAIAGAPGSGKSTLAERAVEILNEEGVVNAALFPMDGYHYDDMVLEKLGRRENKGAADTFDVHGLRHMLLRLKKNEDDVIAIPVFDRSIEISRAGGRLIAQKNDIVICEGNYLLVKQAPWNRLQPIFDLTIFIDVDEEELRRRLQQRWRRHGLDGVEINRKVEKNDLPNGLFVISNSLDLEIRIINSQRSKELP
ncbi:nucleoside/nucleotide kinase family protein [Brucella sp. BE17]|uniref:nucleoside/nucleotide kinase family protein n=1 Tax=Brucella sp. BE17 TaxID=3142977 RepID=UPI0031BBAAEA